MATKRKGDPIIKHEHNVVLKTLKAKSTGMNQDKRFKKKTATALINADRLLYNIDDYKVLADPTILPRKKLIDTQNRQSKNYTFSIENGFKNLPETQKAVEK